MVRIPAVVVQAGPGEDGPVRVIGQATGACGGCRGSVLCAGSRVQERSCTARARGALYVGDRVEVAISGSALLTGAAVAYLLPALALLTGAIAGQAMVPLASETGALAGAVAGLGVGFCAVRALMRGRGLRERLVPRVLAAADRVGEGSA